MKHPIIEVSAHINKFIPKEWPFPKILSRELYYKTGEFGLFDFEQMNKEAITIVETELARQGKTVIRVGLEGDTDKNDTTTTYYTEESWKMGCKAAMISVRIVDEESLYK